MMDVVAAAMLLIVPVLIFSIHQVRHRRRFALHKRTQVTLGIVLLVAVVLFELEVRLIGWRQYARESPYYDSLVFPVLYVHLLFAITTVVLWVWTITGALRRFAVPVAPGPYSARHRRIGWIAAIDMILTAVTGWVFYYLAFIA